MNVRESLRIEVEKMFISVLLSKTLSGRGQRVDKRSTESST